MAALHIQRLEVDAGRNKGFQDAGAVQPMNLLVKSAKEATDTFSEGSGYGEYGAVPSVHVAPMQQTEEVNPFGDSTGYERLTNTEEVDTQRGTVKDESKDRLASLKDSISGYAAF